MKQGTAPGYLDVGVDFLGDHRSDVRGLDGVSELVLSVARAEAKPAEDIEHLPRQPAAVCLDRRLIARFADDAVNVPLRLGDGFLDAGGMDAAIGDQTAERQPANLAADRVEAGDRDDIRRVIDDQVAAQGRFERADVAALAADNSAFHLVGGNLND